MLLIVDDDPNFLGAALDWFGGRSALVARDAEHARDLLATAGPDISTALIDLDLPKESGFELIRDLRERFPDLTIIAISGVFQNDVLQSAKVLGATEVLSKPITAEWAAALARLRIAGL